MELSELLNLGMATLITGVGSALLTYFFTSIKQGNLMDKKIDKSIMEHEVKKHNLDINKEISVAIKEHSEDLHKYDVQELLREHEEHCDVKCLVNDINKDLQKVIRSLAFLVGKQGGNLDELGLKD